MARQPPTLAEFAQPKKPLPEPVDLEHYRQALVSGTISEYRLVA